MTNHPPSRIVPPAAKRSAAGGLHVRIVATGAIVVLAGLSAGRVASASFDETSAPIGDVTSHDSIVSGTVGLTGDRLVFYSGDRFRSNSSDLAVNFSSGGSLILCPHSQVQILSANRNAGVMLAFEEGGSEQPFSVRPSDVVMTPDWRVQLQGDVHQGDTGTLQISTSRTGVMCLSGNLRPGVYFQVSQLLGDSVYNVTGQSSIRISAGHIENSPGGCACTASPGDATAALPSPPIAAAALPASPIQPSPSQPALIQPAAIQAAPVQSLVQPSPSNPAAAPQSTVSAVNLTPALQKNQHPRDVAGYVRSFLHLVFGR